MCVCVCVCVCVRVYNKEIRFSLRQISTILILSYSFEIESH